MNRQMNRYTNGLLSTLSACLCLSLPLAAWGADPPTPPAAEVPAEKPAEEKPAEEKSAERIAKLEKHLSGSTFVGRFTIDGKEGELKEDRYELQSVTKMPTGDLWLFKTRIKYGDHDVTVPLPIPVKWVDDTPMIVVDQLAIPGLGTFDARVVISGDRYAGTWQHGDVGGHMFGRIERTAKP